MKKLFALALALLCAVAVHTNLPTANAHTPYADDATCPATIPFGEVFNCSLSAVSEEDTYTFTGSVNDQLKFRMLRTSGTFMLDIRTYDASNTLINTCSRYSYSVLVSFNCSLTSSGTYTVRIRDFNNTATGAYQVYVQRLNAVGSASAIAFGQVMTGTIDTPIESDTYSFSAGMNDKLSLRLVRTSGTFLPQIRVHDSAGNLVSACSKYSYSELVSITCSVTANGVYSVLVDDLNSAATGAYTLHFQRFNQPGNAMPNTFGQPIAGGLSQSAEMDVYKLDLATNDLLLIRLLRTSGSYTPRFRLFDQDGVLTCSVYSYSALADDDGCAITKAGVYALIVDDLGELGTGDYTLHTQRINNPGNALPIVFGQSVNDSIASVAAVDTYTFQATQNDKVRIKMTRTSGAFLPRIRIFTSGGLALCSNYSYGATADTKDCPIPATGTFIALIDDLQTAGVGAYSLTLMCSSGPCASAGKTFVYAPLVRR